MKLKIVLIVLISLNLFAEDWTASDIVAEGIKQNKKIYLGYDQDLEERAIIDLYRTIGEKEVKKINITRFKVKESLNTLISSPYYTYLISSGIVKSDNKISLTDSESLISDLPHFSSDDSFWLVLTEKTTPEILKTINTLQQKSEIFSKSDILGLFQQKAAFKVVDSKSYGGNTNLTPGDIHDLKIIYEIYKANGIISKPPLAQLKTTFGKELAGKLNQK